MTDLKHAFWSRMDDVQAGMLGLKSGPRLIPMAPSVDDDVPDHIWFITAHGTDLAQATAQGAQPARFVVADGSAGLYADIDGTLAQVDDAQALDEVWSVFASAWFDEGKEDKDICLLRFSPASADVSVTPTSGAKVLFEIAKGNLTDDRPDMGTQGPITF
ncbi:MAG: pyridoxamine 5'-phosphate oxidase family protein [Pseudomonadota bacterium]